MDFPKYWELVGYLKIDNSILRFISEQVFFPFNKHFQEYPVITVLIFCVLLVIGFTVFLFIWVIHLRLKLNRYQKLKARKFAVWEQNLFPLIIDGTDISTIIKTIKRSEYELFGEFITPYLNDTKGDSLTRMVGILREIGVAERERRKLKHSNSARRRALAVQRLGVFRDPNNIKDLVKYHKEKKKIATVTAVQQRGRFGNIEMENELVKNFKEKPLGDGSWVNGGFFVLEPQVFDYLKDENTVWEREPLEKLAKVGQLSVYKHTNFWKPLDTLRDKDYLEKLWASGKAPWKIW